MKNLYSLYRYYKIRKALNCCRNQKHLQCDLHNANCETKSDYVDKNELPVCHLQHFKMQVCFLQNVETLVLLRDSENA